MEELRKCGFIQEVKASDDIQINFNNIHLFMNQILEQFSSIPLERLEEIANKERNKDDND